MASGPVVCWGCPRGIVGSSPSAQGFGSFVIHTVLEVTRTAQAFQISMD
jgi:hypothetical protein